tara:strand:+ start:2893 stop:4134 length:1242 start_codon:yes stop_codon:yes gene_type:complete
MAKKKKPIEVGFKAQQKVNLASAGGKPKKAKGKNPGYRAMIAPKAISQTRQDIASWEQALKMTRLLENPKWFKLQQLFDNIFKDGHLKSQYKNRVLPVLSEQIVLKKKDGTVDLEQTEMINDSIWAKQINRHILNATHRGYSVFEFGYDEIGNFKVELIPRENIDPINGAFYPDYTDDKKILYRDSAEYGTWLIEIIEEDEDEGLFNASVPHVLFKRFAQSCWSELCEINGIPPRVMKTNTQDPVMVRRAEKMMRDMGAAAWFIIDESEHFEWAKAAVQNGEVYEGLIKLCKDEISLLMNGAVIGQDTKHGNESKEDSSKELQSNLTDDDLDNLVKTWNTKIIPALQSIGILKGEITYGYEQSEDVGQLFEFTKGLLDSGKDVDNDWLNEKFGVKVIGDKKQPQQNLSLDFFD